METSVKNELSSLIDDGVVAPSERDAAIAMFAQYAEDIRGRSMVAAMVAITG